MEKLKLNNIYELIIQNELSLIISSTSWTPGIF